MFNPAVQPTRPDDDADDFNHKLFEPNDFTRSSLAQALFNELPKGVRIGINQPYPTTLPLVSVPAKMLAMLPLLPDTLEYRLIDRHVLLRDRDANLVIDMLSGVLPQRDR